MVDAICPATRRIVIHPSAAQHRINHNPNPVHSSLIVSLSQQLALSHWSTFADVSRKPIETLTLAYSGEYATISWLEVIEGMPSQYSTSMLFLC